MPTFNWPEPTIIGEIDKEIIEAARLVAERKPNSFRQGRETTWLLDDEPECSLPSRCDPRPFRPLARPLAKLITEHLGYQPLFEWFQFDASPVEPWKCQRLFGNAPYGRHKDSKPTFVLSSHLSTGCIWGEDVNIPVSILADIQAHHAPGYSDDQLLLALPHEVLLELGFKTGSIRPGLLADISSVYHWSQPNEAPEVLDKLFVRATL